MEGLQRSKRVHIRARHWPGRQPRNVLMVYLSLIKVESFQVDLTTVHEMVLCVRGGLLAWRVHEIEAKVHLTRHLEAEQESASRKALVSELLQSFALEPYVGRADCSRRYIVIF